MTTDARVASTGAAAATRPPRRLERALARACLVLSALVVGLALAEAGSYLVWGAFPHLTGWEFPVENTRVPKPYVVFGGDARVNNVAELNRLGYRGRQPTPDKPLGEFRVFMLGGSTVFHGQPPIAPLLEACLHEKGRPQARVYNFGCVSQVTGQELARVLHEIAGLAPDLILHYSGGNDLWMPFEHDPRPNYPYNFLVYEANPLLDLPGAGRRALLGLAGYSNLVRHLGGVGYLEAVAPREPLRELAGAYSSTWQDQIAAAYVGNLLKSAQVARGCQARSVAVLQPIACDPVLFEKQGAEKVNTHRVLVEHFADLRRRVLVQAAQAIQRDGLDFHDLSLLFRDRDPVVFEDSVHVQQAVFPEIAVVLSDLLLPYIPPADDPSSTDSPAPLARLWQLSCPAVARARLMSAGVNSGALRVELIGGAAASPPDVRLARRLPPLCRAQHYRVRLRLRADAPRPVTLVLAPWAERSRPLGQEKIVGLTPDWQTVELDWTSPVDEPDLEVELQLGGSDAAVELAGATLLSPDAPPLPTFATSDGLPDAPAIRRANHDQESFWFSTAPQGVRLFDAPADQQPHVRRLEIDAAADAAPGRVAWRRRFGPLVPGAERRVTFWARSDTPRVLTAAIENWVSRWYSEADFSAARQELSLDNQWRPFHVDFTAGSAGLVSLTLLTEPRSGWIEIDEHRRDNLAPAPTFTVRLATPPADSQASPAATGAAETSPVPTVEPPAADGNDSATDRDGSSPVDATP